MGGGKETPRQKMIGLMYLVLMAMLAMNVSKEIINAFVTLNNKLESSIEQTEAANFELSGFFESAFTTLKVQGAPPAEDDGAMNQPLFSVRASGGLSPDRKEIRAYSTSPVRSYNTPRYLISFIV